MQAKETVAALGALAHDTRLEVFRLLVQRGPDGLPAGVIAEKLGIPPSSLTFHLQQLAHAGLITQRRSAGNCSTLRISRAMNGLVAYLTENCCGGAACGPVCAPATTGADTTTASKGKIA